MEIPIDIQKSIEDNAAQYYESAKKAKNKAQGALLALEESRLKLTKHQKPSTTTQNIQKNSRQKKWYEKFRWFITSDNVLCVGGRDATSNEIIVKKHTSEMDIVFHTQLSGSPFFVLKFEGKPIEKSLEEAAVAVASFSRAWKLGLTHVEVFSVKPSQLTKTAKAGEYVQRGSFIVTGHVDTRTVELKLALGLTKDKAVMCGPISAIRKNCKVFVTIVQGNSKSSDIAKKIRKKFGGEIDDIVRALPSGGCRIV